MTSSCPCNLPSWLLQTSFLTPSHLWTSFLCRVLLLKLFTLAMWCRFSHLSNSLFRPSKPCMALLCFPLSFFLCHVQLKLSVLQFSCSSRRLHFSVPPPPPICNSDSLSYFKSCLMTRAFGNVDLVWLQIYADSTVYFPLSPLHSPIVSIFQILDCSLFGEGTCSVLFCEALYTQMVLCKQEV